MRTLSEPGTISLPTAHRPDGVLGPTRAPVAPTASPGLGRAAELRGRAALFCGAGGGRPQAQRSAPAASTSSGRGHYLSPTLAEYLGKPEEYITGSVRGTKRRFAAGHAEVDPRQNTRAPAPAKPSCRAEASCGNFPLNSRGRRPGPLGLSDPGCSGVPGSALAANRLCQPFRDETLLTVILLTVIFVSSP